MAIKITLADEVSCSSEFLLPDELLASTTPSTALATSCTAVSMSTW